jgi:hypothetical protein
MGLMNDRRLELHEKLCTILGSRNVYFQPPNGKQLKYPCIIYKRDSSSAEYADNMTYMFTPEYQITYISTTSVNDVVEKLLDEFEMIRYIRHYVADNLSHDILNLFY